GTGESTKQRAQVGPARPSAGPGVAAAMRPQLKEASGAKRRELLVGFVRQEAMKTLGVTETIDATRPLRELGLDSLMSVTLVNQLEAALGIKISTVKLIQGPSIEQLVDDILPDVTGSDDDAATQALQPELAVGVWPNTAGLSADEDAVPQPVVSQPEHCVGSWPIAAEPTLGGNGRPPRPIAIQPKSHAGRWLINEGPRAAPGVRLFCVPFAGGGCVVYRSWARFIDPEVEVVAIEPPGRLGRITETPIADMKKFVEQLVPEMEELLDRPFVFFGHCLGALTMYET